MCDLHESKHHILNTKYSQIVKHFLDYRKSGIIKNMKTTCSYNVVTNVTKIRVDLSFEYLYGVKGKVGI